MRFFPALYLFCLIALQPAWGENISLKIGKNSIHAEIANTPLSREQGLMQRSRLCANCGMLFIFDKADRYSFWMKNTPLPLSIAFIAADGSILNIEEMQPNTEEAHPAQSDALYALEMNSGWFTRNGIKRGKMVLGLKQAPTGY
jgi:uncharacterized membrane protein (UPF0127 family)